MTRIDSLPENQTITQLHQLRKELDELKQRQLVGDDNLLTFMNIGTTIVQDMAPNTSYRWQVVFEPFSGINSLNVFAGTLALSNPTGSEVSGYSVDPEYSSEEGIVVWIVDIANHTNAQTATVKLGFNALESGVVSWTRTL